MDTFVNLSFYLLYWNVSPFESKPESSRSYISPVLLLMHQTGFTSFNLSVDLKKKLKFLFFEMHDIDFIKSHF